MFRSQSSSGVTATQTLQARMFTLTVATLEIVWLSLMKDDNDLGLFSSHPSLGGERTPISKKEILTSIGDQFQTLGFLASQQEETFQKISFLIADLMREETSEEELPSNVIPFRSRNEF